MALGVVGGGIIAFVLWLSATYGDDRPRLRGTLGLEIAGCLADNRSRLIDAAAAARSGFGAIAAGYWMTRMLQEIWPDRQADIRELIVQTESTTAVHALVGRPRPDQIQGRYEIDEALTTPAPTSIAIVDDVLTTGAHFCAARAVLARIIQEGSGFGREARASVC